MRATARVHASITRGMTDRSNGWAWRRADGLAGHDRSICGSDPLTPKPSPLPPAHTLERRFRLRGHGSGDASSSLDPSCIHTQNPPIDRSIDRDSTTTDSVEDAPERLDRSTSHLDLGASANARGLASTDVTMGAVSMPTVTVTTSRTLGRTREVCVRERRAWGRECVGGRASANARETSSMTTDRPRTRDRPEPVWMTTETETTTTTTTTTTTETTTTRCVCRRVLLHSSPSSFSSSPSRGRADRSIVITHHHREGVLSKDGEGGAPRGGREGEREGRAREGRDGWDS